MNLSNYKYLNCFIDVYITIQCFFHKLVCILSDYQEMCFLNQHNGFMISALYMYTLVFRRIKYIVLKQDLVKYNIDIVGQVHHR